MLSVRGRTVWEKEEGGRRKEKERVRRNIFFIWVD